MSTADPSVVAVRPRTAIALAVASVTGLLAFTWPLLVTPGSVLADGTQAPLVLALVVVGVLAVVLTALTDGAIDAKGVAVLGLLSAVGAVVRPLSAGTAGVELVFVVIVLGARVLGPGFGFALGSTTLLTSALLTGGVGPWLPFQMLAASWVGLGAGLLPRGVRGRREVLLVAAYGAVAALGFGILMNLAFWPFQLGSATALSFVAGAPVVENLGRFAAYTLATSLGWDVGRAITTVIGVLLLGHPLLVALRRTAVRAAFRPAARVLPAAATPPRPPAA
ncbi:MAG: ECF transporter S component [Actinotalea sp.]|nr:ECF transporter S component [Actinotalea sp.]